jgi:hypothetical protein
MFVASNPAATLTMFFAAFTHALASAGSNSECHRLVRNEADRTFFLQLSLIFIDVLLLFLLKR